MQVQRQSYRVDMVAARGIGPARRRWRWYRCKPLVAVMYLAAGLATVPIWLWLVAGLVH